MKFLQKIEQNWSLKCENRSIIGDLMSDQAWFSGLLSYNIEMSLAAAALHSGF